MEEFDYRNFLVENKLTINSRLLNEEEKLDYKIVDKLKNLYFDLEKPIENMLRNYSILMNKYQNNYSGKSDAEERDFSSTITLTKSKDWGILKKVDKLVDLILKSNLKVNKDGVRLHDAILSLGQDVRGYFDSYDDGTSNVFKLISSEDDGLRIVGIKQKYKEIKELIDKLQTPIQSRPDF